MTRPIFEFARARGTEARIGQLNPLQRHGLPAEIAAAALFLASDEASYVNGQAFAVDGGLSSTHPFAGQPAVTLGARPRLTGAEGAARQ